MDRDGAGPRKGPSHFGMLRLNVFFSSIGHLERQPALSHVISTQHKKADHQDPGIKRLRSGPLATGAEEGLEEPHEDLTCGP